MSVVVTRFYFLIPFLFILAISSEQETTDSLIEAQIGGPNPIFSIGHNIQKKGHGFVRCFAYRIKESEKNSSFVTHNGLYYGITDTLTVNIRIPGVKYPKSPPLKSSGVGNVHLQAEWAFYNHFDKHSLSQATLVGTVRIPSSNVQVITIDTSKSPTFLVGATTSNWSDQWHTYGDASVNLTTTHKHFKLGNQFYYDLGLGRIVYSKTLSRGGLLYVELLMDTNGLYSRPNTVHRKQDLSTGSFVAYLGPTFRFSLPNFALLGGMQYPIAQTYRDPATIRSHYKFALGGAFVF